MTGIERLRELIKDYRSGHECEVIECGELSCGECIAKNVLEPIATQIEREQVEAAADHAVVASVASDMERHCLGVEGMEDSPVARWARELRAALGGEERDPSKDVSMSAYDLLPEEDREAIAWVREHGGLDAVKKMAAITLDVYQRLVDGNAGPEMLETDADTIDAMMAEIDEAIVRRSKERTAALALLDESVPRSTYESHILKRQRQIDESHAALRRRNARIVELEQECDELREMVRSLNALTDEMEKRLMPEGMEWLVEAWPRFEDDAPVRFGDMALIDGDADMVEAVQLWIHGRPVIYGDGGSQQLEKGERVKRPAPKVLDADGAEIRVGDEVWLTDGLGPWSVSRIVVADRMRVVCDDEKNGHLNVYPENITHRAPVLAADGRPLREGETVYHTKSWMDKEPRVIERLEPLGDVTRVWFSNGNYEWSENLTHERPDSWKRLEEDADNVAMFFENFDADAAEDIRDLVRRAKALAERDA